MVLGRYLVVGYLDPLGDYRLFSGIRFYFLGFWAPIILP